MVTVMLTWLCCWQNHYVSDLFCHLGDYFNFASIDSGTKIFYLQYVAIIKLLCYLVFNSNSSFDLLVKWGASSRWSSSLYCSMQNPVQMTTGKTHLTLMLMIMSFWTPFKANFYSSLFSFIILLRLNLLWFGSNHPLNQTNLTSL